ncbi:MAG: pyridoxamine 5'-phosphate oxidase [Anaerolineales bacterium]
MLRADLSPNPFTQFGLWFAEAERAGILTPNAMTLATATRDGIPSARMVLLKGFDETGFTFFTNYESQKGRELAQNPHAALVFYWDPLNRQIRITGQVARLTAAESDAYFQTRPRGSQIAAWASRQSTVLENRTILHSRYNDFMAQFGDDPIPRPRYWGGYRLTPRTLEFWQSGANRLHDRIRYTHQNEGWLIERLAP